MVVEVKLNAPPDSRWKLVYDETVVQVYESDRSTIIPSGQISTGPLSPNPSNFWIEGLAPSAGTSIELHLDLDGDGTFDCSDNVVATTRPLWTNTPFPQMTFTTSNVAPTVDNAAPHAGTGTLPNGQLGPGFGSPSVQYNPAITWNPQVTLASNGDHVTYNQFTVGVVQNMRNFIATFVYDDGTKVARGLLPSLDQDNSGIGAPFYGAGSVAGITACGSATLNFSDRPFGYSAWFNPCPNHSGLILGISFQDNLETWLVARHNPSGCFTVLKHFTWNQSFQSTGFNLADRTMNGQGTTNRSAVDSGAGGTPVLNGQAWNSTVGQGDCQ